MKRRDFLKTLPIIAGAPLVLAATSPFPQTANGRHLIALGTSACFLASNHFSELFFDTFTFIDFEEQEAFRERDTFIPFTTPDYILEQLGKRMLPKEGFFPVIPLNQEIQNHLNGLKGDLVFFAGLGWMTETLLFQSIGCHYKNPLQRLEFLAVMPFSFQGIWRGKQARQTIQVFADQRREPTCLFLDEVIGPYGNISIPHSFEKSDQWVVSELNAI